MYGQTNYDSQKCSVWVFCYLFVVFFRINALLFDFKTNEERFLWGFKIISN